MVNVVNLPETIPQITFSMDKPSTNGRFVPKRSLPEDCSQGETTDDGLMGYLYIYRYIEATKRQREMPKSVVRWSFDDISPIFPGFPSFYL